MLFVEVTVLVSGAASALSAIEPGDEFEQSVLGGVDLACQQGGLMAKYFVVIGERWNRREGEISHGKRPLSTPQAFKDIAKGVLPLFSAIDSPDSVVWSIIQEFGR